MDVVVQRINRLSAAGSEHDHPDGAENFPGMKVAFSGRLKVVSPELCTEPPSSEKPTLISRSSSPPPASMPKTASTVCDGAAVEGTASVVEDTVPEFVTTAARCLAISSDTGCGRTSTGAKGRGDCTAD